MNKRFVTTAVCLAFLALPITSHAGDTRIGGGATYWTSIDDLNEDGESFDNDGYSLLASYQYWEGLFGLELDCEFLPDRFGENAIAPQAWLLFGEMIYAGAGIGTTNTDGDWADEPFYALRAGLNLKILPHMYADISANYRFNDVADFEDQDLDIDTDTIFLGVALRISL